MGFVAFSSCMLLLVTSFQYFHCVCFYVCNASGVPRALADYVLLHHSFTGTCLIWWFHSHLDLGFMDEMGEVPIHCNIVTSELLGWTDMAPHITLAVCDSATYIRSSSNQNMNHICDFKVKGHLPGCRSEELSQPAMFSLCSCREHATNPQNALYWEIMCYNKRKWHWVKVC